MATRRVTLKQLASKVEANNAEEGSDEIVSDPEYNRKTSSIDSTLYLPVNGRSGGVDSGIYEVEEFCNMYAGALRAEMLRALNSAPLTERHWKRTGYKVLVEGNGTLKLRVYAEETDSAYNERIAQLEGNRARLQAVAKARKKAVPTAELKIPKKLTTTQREKLTYTERDKYDTDRYDMINLKRIARKFNLALPKEFDE